MSGARSYLAWIAGSLFTFWVLATFIWLDPTIVVSGPMARFSWIAIGLYCGVAGRSIRSIGK